MKVMAVLPLTVYRRAKEPAELLPALRLKALEWALYFAVTGAHTAAELGRQMRAAAEARDAALMRLASLGLIVEAELDAAEYVRALAAAGDGEEKTLREFLMAAAAPLAPPVPVVTPAVPADLTAPRTASLAEVPFIQQATDAGGGAQPNTLQAAAAAPQPLLREVEGGGSTSTSRTTRPGRTPLPAFGFKPLPVPGDDARETQRMARSRRFSVRALMNLIEGRAGSREAGQLDVYRVFVRVDTLLLKRNGIETLRFTEDRLISDPELEQALVRSLKKTLGLDCPESVWVEVA